MKKKISLVVLLVLLLNCAYTPRHYLSYEKTRPIVISALVGETIDPEEREKFDLFHGIEGFKSAMFYEIPDGGYEIEIITEQTKLVAVNRDTKAIPIMRDYIGRNEKIKDSTSAFEKKWEIVDYDDMGQPITRDEVNRVKSHGYRIGCGVGGCLLGLIPLAILGIVVAIAGQDPLQPEHPERVFIVSIAGLTVSAVLGALLGNKFDRSRALEVIKKGRQPRVAGHF